MKRTYASQKPTLLEIAEILGISPDTALEWIVEGKLRIDLKGSQAILTVDRKQPLKNRHAAEILILTKRRPNQKWRAFSC